MPPSPLSRADASNTFRLRDLGDGTALLYRPDTGAHIVLNGTLVDEDTVNAHRIIETLGGTPADWAVPLRTARSLLALMDEHAPRLPHPVRARILRAMTRTVDDRQQAAARAHARNETASWARVAYALDPAPVVREFLAHAGDLTGRIGHLAASLLVHRADGPHIWLLSNPTVHGHLDLTAALAASSRPLVRREAATHLPATDPALLRLALDPDPQVQQTMARRLDDPDTTAAIKANRARQRATTAPTAP